VAVESLLNEYVLSLGVSVLLVKHFALLLEFLQLLVVTCFKGCARGKIGLTGNARSILSYSEPL
jgi:hypothetical protein